MLALIVLLLGGLTSVKVRSFRALCALSTYAGWRRVPTRTAPGAHASGNRRKLSAPRAACACAGCHCAMHLCARAADRRTRQVVLWSVPALMSNSTLVFLETLAGAYEASRSERSKQVRAPTPPASQRQRAWCALTSHGCSALQMKFEERRGQRPHSHGCSAPSFASRARSPSANSSASRCSLPGSCTRRGRKRLCASSCTRSSAPSSASRPQRSARDAVARMAARAVARTAAGPTCALRTMSTRMRARAAAVTMCSKGVLCHASRCERRAGALERRRRARRERAT